MSKETSFNKSREKSPLALIAGPTASGKSDLAVRLALALEARGSPATVINADSAQVYADLAILSARPSAKEMSGIKHRLFGAWDGSVACSAADWAAAAREEIKAAHLGGIVPILVGGTGLYIRTLLEGIAPVPEIDPAVRRAVRALPVAEAYVALAREDPERAAALSPSDAARIARALEVTRSTGRSLKAWQAQKTGGIGDAVTLYPTVLLPDRQTLYERCDQRFSRMLATGALAEVEALLARELDSSLPVMRAIGVKELSGYIRGQWSLPEAENRSAQATRNYVKRQFTWLRHQPPEEWPRQIFEPFSERVIFEILLQ